MPMPTNPPCIGSWPEPPPETIPTLPCTGASARTTIGRVVVDPDEVGVGGGDTLEGLLDDVLDVVDQLLHVVSVERLGLSACGRARGEPAPRTGRLVSFRRPGRFPAGIPSASWAAPQPGTSQLNRRTPRMPPMIGPTTGIQA